MDTFCHYCKRYCRFIYFLLGKSLLYSGNIVDWNSAGWTAENLHEFDLELETIKAESYLKSSYQLFISEKKKSFADSLKFCQDIGGEIGVAESNLAVTEMISAVQSKGAECDGIRVAFCGGRARQASPESIEIQNAGRAERSTISLLPTQRRAAPPSH